MPPDTDDLEDGFNDALVFFIGKYRILIDKEGENLPPAAACVVLLCTVIDNAFAGNTDDEEGDG